MELLKEKEKATMMDDIVLSQIKSGNKKVDFCSPNTDTSFDNHQPDKAEHLDRHGLTLGVWVGPLSAGAGEGIAVGQCSQAIKTADATFSPKYWMLDLNLTILGATLATLLARGLMVLRTPLGGAAFSTLSPASACSRS
ncbi:MAG: hypothetical protein FRX49_13634 [Trebouxia sp. A1-2]|nr:MAG: hypothetical protein FRX49_13634 [Trebouxia sp. A1-2]